MNEDLEQEIRIIYIAFFATFVASLVPTLPPYAAGALGLQWFFVVIRYMNIQDPVYRSHAMNYIIGVGVALLMGVLISLQWQFVVKAPFTAVVDNFETIRSVPHMFVMMLVEAIIAFVLPIIMIIRGLYLLNMGRPAFSASRDAGQAYGFTNVTPGSTPRVDPERFNHVGAKRGWLASAVLADGRVIRFELPIDGRPRTIGRSVETADIVLDDRTVSRPHARLESRDGVLWISDLGSRNHTHVNGKKVGSNPVQIHVADQIKLGEVKLTISTL